MKAAWGLIGLMVWLPRAAWAQTDTAHHAVIGCYEWTRAPQVQPTLLPPAAFQLQGMEPPVSNGRWFRAWPPLHHQRADWPRLYGAIPPLWRGIGQDSIEVFWTTGSESIAIRAAVSEHGLSGSASAVEATFPWLAPYSASSAGQVEAQRTRCKAGEEHTGPSRADSLAVMRAVAKVVAEKVEGRAGVWSRFACGNRVDCESGVGTNPSYWSLTRGEELIAALADAVGATVIKAEEAFRGGVGATVRVSPPVFEGDRAAVRLWLHFPGHYEGHGVLLRRRQGEWVVDVVNLEVVS